VIELAKLQDLASNYRNKAVYLSADSLTLIYCLFQYTELYYWRGATSQFELTTEEKDTIEALSAKAFKEVQAMDVMIGMVVPYVGVDPTGRLLLCDGSTYNRVDYPDLYSILQSNWILDADTFKVPDLINRFVLGTDDDMAATGGEESVTLTTGQLARHAHQPNLHSHGYTGAVAALGAALVGVPIPSAVPAPLITAVGGNATQSEGNDESHNNMPPYQKILYAIVAK
jgi:microcystin-dependent protein